MNGPTIAADAGGDLVVTRVSRPSDIEQVAVFDDVFVEHYPRVVEIIARVVTDRSHAEQLAADVFWKLYRKSVFKPRDANVGGWLYRAAVRTALDALRKASRRERHEAAAGVEQVRGGRASDPLADVLRDERRKQVRAALLNLKRRDARLLLLRASGLCYRDIATTLKLNVGSVGTLLSRAEDAFERQYRAIHGNEY